MPWRPVAHVHGPRVLEIAVSTKNGLEAQPASESGRLRVLELLRSAPGGLGVTDLAMQLGLHTNTVRFHLNRLVAAGLATRDVEQRNGPGRPRLTFAAAPKQDTESGRRSYQLLADMLAGFIADTSANPAAQGVELGRTWGRYLATKPAPAKRVTEEEALSELLHVLDDIGFSPRLAEDDNQQTQVLLRHCPFLEVASAHGEVVCSLHLGVIQGVLIEQRASLEASHLQPFVEPSLCVAHLSRRELSPSRS
jgi:predicted ArsR family transcriptional regulator